MKTTLETLLFASIPALVLSLGTSCSSKPIPSPTTPAPTAETEQVAEKTGADLVAEIVFEKGSAKLSKDHQNALRRLLGNALSDGQLELINVVSWADRSYPERENEKLPKSQKILADQRNQAVVKFLKSELKDRTRKKTRLNWFNMAERPTPLESLVGTAAAKLKQAVESAGKPSKSLIMVILNGDAR